MLSIRSLGVLWVLSLLARTIIETGAHQTDSTPVLDQWRRSYKLLFYANAEVKEVRNIYDELLRLIKVEKSESIRKELRRQMSHGRSRLFVPGRRMPTYIKQTREASIILGLINKRKSLSEIIKYIFERESVYCLASDLDKLKNITSMFGDKTTGVNRMLTLTFRLQHLNCSSSHQSSLAHIYYLLGHETTFIIQLIKIIPISFFDWYELTSHNKMSLIYVLTDLLYDHLRNKGVLALGTIVSDFPKLENFRAIIDIEIGERCRNLCNLCKYKLDQIMLLKSKYGHSISRESLDRMNGCRLCCIVTDYPSDLEAKLLVKIIDDYFIHGKKWLIISKPEKDDYDDIDFIL